MILFNPFKKIAGFKALGMGLLIMSVTAVLAWVYNVRFDGVLDMHVFDTVNVKQVCADQVLNLLILVCVFYLMSAIMGARPRWVDMAGTMALARAPFLLAPLCNMNGRLLKLARGFKDISASDSFVLIIIALLMLLLLAWVITLYFNAWKICTNLKGRHVIAGFIAGLFLSEIGSVYIIRVLLTF